MEKEAIRKKLDRLKAKGRGGIELAWVYPLSAMKEEKDPIDASDRSASRAFGAKRGRDGPEPQHGRVLCLRSRSTVPFLEGNLLQFLDQAVLSALISIHKGRVHRFTGGNIEG